MEDLAIALQAGGGVDMEDEDDVGEGGSAGGGRHVEGVQCDECEGGGQQPPMAIMVTVARWLEAVVERAGEELAAAEVRVGCAGGRLLNPKPSSGVRRREGGGRERTCPAVADTASIKTTDQDWASLDTTVIYRPYY